VTYSKYVIVHENPGIFQSIPEKKSDLRLAHDGCSMAKKIITLHGKKMQEKGRSFKVGVQREFGIKVAKMIQNREKEIVIWREKQKNKDLSGSAKS
jgi:hypothetical protein